MLNFIKRLESYIQEQINDVPVKKSPQALFAPQSYDLLDMKGIILLWVDSVPNYLDKNVKLDNQSLVPGVFYPNIRIIISVGLRSLQDALDLDELVERIVSTLSMVKIGDYTPLKPVSISKMTIDANSVCWRQIVFETSIKMIALPTVLDL